jgi:hypothetical protein
MSVGKTDKHRNTARSFIIDVVVVGCWSSLSFVLSCCWKLEINQITATQTSKQNCQSLSHKESQPFFT